MRNCPNCGYKIKDIIRYITKIEVKTCFQCKNEYEYRLGHAGEKFCSRSCWKESFVKNYKIDKCQNCGKRFKYRIFKSSKQRKYCSIKCRKSSSPNQKDQNNHNWKGDRAGYVAIHTWINRKLGKPDICEHCKSDNLFAYKIQWANKDHKYKRNLKDWIRLCSRCHKRYDLKHKLIIR